MVQSQNGNTIVINARQTGFAETINKGNLPYKYVEVPFYARAVQQVFEISKTIFKGQVGPIGT